jgi:8-oxo-dGTP pyrophosphatase MutT (NUDIX family)
MSDDRRGYGERPIADVPLPDWWHPLARRAATVDVREITSWVPPPGTGRPSAVLILLAGDADDVEDVEAGDPEAPDSDGGAPGPDVLLLQRADTLRSHAGQPAFPGGAADPDDRDPAATALREAAEEVGLRPDTVTVVTTLPELWVPVSDFRVTPVLGWWHRPHPVSVVDPAEVASVARVPVAELADPENRLRVRHPSGYTGPAFAVRKMLVWGFTAGILSSMLDLAGWSRPWDRQKVADLPPESLALAGGDRSDDAPARRTRPTR